MYNGKQRDVAHSGAEPVTDHMYPGNLSDIDLWLFLSPGDQDRPCIPDHYSKAKKEQAQEKDALAGPSLGISADTPSRKATGYDQPEPLKPSRHFFRPCGCSSSVCGTPCSFHIMGNRKAYKLDQKYSARCPQIRKNRYIPKISQLRRKISRHAPEQLDQKRSRRHSGNPRRRKAQHDLPDPGRKPCVTADSQRLQKPGTLGASLPVKR